MCATLSEKDRNTCERRILTGGKDEPLRRTHGMRRHMTRDAVSRTEWYFGFRRSSCDPDRKSPQAQKTPVWGPRRWNLAEKRPASWRSYESCSLARFRSKNCTLLSESDVAGGTRRSGMPLHRFRNGVKFRLGDGCVAPRGIGAKTTSGMDGRRSKKKGCNTRTSQEVTHPSTTLAQARLTAEF